MGRALWFTTSISVQKHSLLLLGVPLVFFIISKSNDLEAQHFTLLRHKILNEIG